MNARTESLFLTVPEMCLAALPSGIAMPYVACGSGEPMVFVHGSLCDYRYWKSQADFLSKNFLCVSVSLSHYWPGNHAFASGEFSLKAHVAELAEFITAMNLGPVHLVGHSRGGCAAFHLAHEYPHLVKTLILADPGGPLHVEGKPEAALPAATLALREKAASLIQSGEIEAGLELFVDSVSMPGIWRKSPASFRRMAIDNAATLPKQFRDPLPAYTQDAARKVECRTLLLEGEKSPRMYRSNAQALLDWIDHADRQTIAGASHGMNVTHHGAFNRMVQAFISA